MSPSGLAGVSGALHHFYKETLIESSSAAEVSLPDLILIITRKNHYFEQVRLPPQESTSHLCIFSNITFYINYFKL